jgi:hypothetical protein
MFIDKTRADEGEPDEINRTQPSQRSKNQESSQRGGVEQGGDSEGSRDTKPDHHRTQPFAFVHFQILRGVNDIKSGHPAKNRRPKNQRRPGETPGDGEPRPDRGDSQR